MKWQFVEATSFMLINNDSETIRYEKAISLDFLFFEVRHRQQPAGHQITNLS